MRLPKNGRGVRAQPLTIPRIAGHATLLENFCLDTRKLPYTIRIRGPQLVAPTITIGVLVVVGICIELFEMCGTALLFLALLLLTFALLMVLEITLVTISWCHDCLCESYFLLAF